MNDQMSDERVALSSNLEWILSSLHTTFQDAMQTDNIESVDLEPMRRLKDFECCRPGPPKRFYRTAWRGIVLKAVSLYNMK